MNNTAKRSLEDEEMETDSCTPENIEKKTSNVENKKLCSSQEASTSTNVVSKEHILNSPLSEENGKCCHLKVR